MPIIPGGGYTVVSPSEGEIVAKKFYEMGYQTAVVTYTTNLLQMIPLKMQPMQDLMRVIRYTRKHAENVQDIFFTILHGWQRSQILHKKLALTS